MSLASPPTIHGSSWTRPGSPTYLSLRSETNALGVDVLGEVQAGMIGRCSAITSGVEHQGCHPIQLPRQGVGFALLARSALALPCASCVIFATPWDSFYPATVRDGFFCSYVALTQHLGALD
jgi:hypothetical protein